MNPSVAFHTCPVLGSHHLYLVPRNTHLPRRTGILEAPLPPTSSQSSALCVFGPACSRPHGAMGSRSMRPRAPGFFHSAAGFGGSLNRSKAPLVASWKRRRLPMQKAREGGFDPWMGKMPWRRARQPPPVFLPGEPHGQRSLAGHSPWGRRELDTAEHIP